MPCLIEPDFEHARRQRYAIVVSSYNKTVTERLLDGALQTFAEKGIADEQLDLARVPGAWELPVVAARLAFSRRYAAVIVLGAVIKGETTHDEYINLQASNSLGQIAYLSGVPVLFGVLTCQNLEQALNRAGGTVGNKGSECAEAALDMAALMNRLPTVLTDLQDGFSSVLSQIGLRGK